MSGSTSTRTAAVLGCGKAVPGFEGFAVGHGHGDGYVKGAPHAKLFAVDPNAENLAAFGDKFELPDDRRFASTAALYEAVTPDIVSVCTWPALHHPMVLEAANAGVKGIICEKPLSVSPIEIDEMIASCKQHGVKLTVAHQRCYEPVPQLLKRIVEQGKLGDKIVFEARIGGGWDMLSWSVHWVDLASFIFGELPENVLAGLNDTGKRRYQHAIEDDCVALAQYPNGRQAIFITGPDDLGLGMLNLRGDKGYAKVTDEGVELFTREGYSYEKPDDGVAGFAGLIADLFDAIENGGTTLLDAERSAESTRTVFAIHESARTLKRVALPTNFGYAPLDIAQHPPTPRWTPGKVLVYADDHHVDAATGISGRDGVLHAAAALGADEVRCAEADERGLVAADLDDIDVILLYHTQRTSDATTRKLLGDWVESGKPLVVLHCGIGAFDDWPQFREWIGVHWVWGDETIAPGSGHPHVPCDVVIDRPDLFPATWNQHWIPRDEVYVRLHESHPVDVIATAHLPDGEQSPAAWQAKAHRNVSVWAPGHRADVFDLPVMVDGIAAMIQLAQRPA
ncbi:MAG: Gfo/Idh/MocA family oxidoreductase [Planctomycetota bacterium]